MAIQKMALVNLAGPLDSLNAAMDQCLNSGIYHPESALHSADTTRDFALLAEQNPYAKLGAAIQNLAHASGIRLHYADYSGLKLSADEMQQFVAEKQSMMEDYNRESDRLKNEILEYEKSLNEVSHLVGMEVSFEEVFACEYVKYRFGKLPRDSADKLKYYSDKTFFFFPERTEGEDVWGAYFAPKPIIGEIDDVFASLYFERVHIPDFVHGKPAEALDAIRRDLEQLKKQFSYIQAQKDACCKGAEELLCQIFSFVRHQDAIYELRGKTAVLGDSFYCVGFVPQEEAKAFVKQFDKVRGVSCIIKPQDADPTLTVPVKLKNNWFTRPFETFVKMYSLPSHKDIDPTGFVALTYTLLFGIMFGDLGQGLLIALIGIVMSKWKKMEFGKILTRIGLSSAVFGTLYGSVFGYEHALDWLYVGILELEHKPIEVFDTGTTNMLLLAAIGLGVILIVVSMCISIYLGFKNKNIEQAVFGHNGIAGLVLYLSLAALIVGIMMPQFAFMNGIGIVLGVVLPIFCIFFAGPLAKAVKGRKDFMPKNIGEYIAENFFEMFEYALSYLSNSMSFLRVGGFILSHAGMMSVVMTLSEMTSNPVVNPIIVICGNLFVMALEGLIVGIQVLRLEFYEMFSRFYEGNGTAYAPIQVSYEMKIE